MLLDMEQTSMATAREFFLVLHLRNNNPLEIPPYLSHVEQIVREQGFFVRRAGQEDVMRIMAMYFEQNVTSDKLETFDGERFVVVWCILEFHMCFAASDMYYFGGFFFAFFFRKKECPNALNTIISKSPIKITKSKNSNIIPKATTYNNIMLILSY